jgi:hypothetical protein
MKNLLATFVCMVFGACALADVKSPQLPGPPNIAAIALDSGSANSYVLAPGVAVGGVISGQLVQFTPAHRNTGASTVAYNGAGAVAIVNEYGSALAGGEISGPTWLQYTGSTWQIVGTGSAPDKARSPAEISNRIVPVNYSYVPGHVLRYGADPSGLADSTSPIQNALTVGAATTTVTIPAGTYSVNGTLSMAPGEVIQGTGWSTIPNQYTVASGTVLVQHSTADVPFVQCVGADASAHQAERCQVKDIALYKSTGNRTGTGFYATNARQLALSDVYITGFNVGINLYLQTWLVHVDHVRVMNFHTVGYLQSLSSEDNLVTNSQFSGYDPNAIAVHLQGENANTTFIDDYFEAVATGVWLDQHDNGSNQPYPLHASFIGCLAEDILYSLFQTSSTDTSPIGGNSTYPGLTVLHLRAYIGTGWTGNSAVITTPTITGASGNGTTATVTFAAQPIAATLGSVVTVYGEKPYGYNGSWIVTASTTTSVSFANTTTGAQTVAGMAAYNGTTYNGSAYNGQSLLFAMQASQIRIEDTFANGFSWGGTVMGRTFPTSPYGLYYHPGIPVGPILWEQDNNSTWGDTIGTTVAATGASGSGTYATIRFATQPFAAPIGSLVTVAGETPAAYNGTFIVIGSTTRSVAYATGVSGAQTVAGTVTLHPGGRFRGVTSNITRVPGDHIISSLNMGTATLTTSGSASYTIPFVAVVSDPAQWASPMRDGWIPLRVGSSVNPQIGQTLRIRSQVAAASAPAGQYQLVLYKNATAIAQLANVTLSATQPLQISGEYYETTQNGSSDFYSIRLFTTVTSAVTIDPTPGNTWAVMELAGT